MNKAITCLFLLMALFFLFLGVSLISEIGVTSIGITLIFIALVHGASILFIRKFTCLFIAIEYYFYGFMLFFFIAIPDPQSSVHHFFDDFSTFVRLIIGGGVFIL